jgi:ABC-2 type transport system ATP-binding protein
MQTVSVQALSKSYGSTPALRDVGFEVAQGEVFALLGPNGAGKTSTLEILEGFRERDSGEVRVLGLDPGDRRTGQHLRSQIGVVLQELAVEPFLSVRQVLARNAGYYASPRPVGEVIELIGLEAKADAKVKTLSGGQQRRLDVGLGIVGRPALLFLDEPTTGLDPEGRRSSWELVRKLSAEGTTVILTTHYMEEAEALADEVAVIAGGRIVAQGPPATLGGRDSGTATIRFQLPDGTSPAELPVSAASVSGGSIEVRTDNEIDALYELTRWARERDVRVTGLTVSRHTLEDVYLQLTGEATDQPQDQRAPAEATR